MRVDLRRRDVRVAEHRLHGAQVGAALEQMGGEAVAQRVRVDALLDACRARVSAEQLPESLPGHVAAARGDEEVGGVASPEQLLARPPEIDVERLAGASADGNDALLAALAAPPSHADHGADAPAGKTQPAPHAPA